MLSLPVSPKRIRSRTAEKKWRHRFSHYKPIFSDVQGQVTPQSVVKSGQNLNSFELSYMSLLPASMGRNGSKAAKKKWRHRFSHHNPICYHGNQCSDLLIQALMYVIITCKYEKDQIKNIREKVETSFSHYKPMGIFQTFKGS